MKLKTDNGLGANNPSFKNIEITEYSFKSPLMGIPTLTAELLWQTCLDDEWTHKEYVELRGERYYIRQVQSSEISNNNVIKYKHSLDFKSEREQLLHVYFYDVVPSWSATYDSPNTNSTEFKFFGTPREFCDRLNCAFRYAGIGDSILANKTALTDLDEPVGDGYCVVLSDYGDGDLDQSQEFEWEDKWLFDALSEGFTKFKIPFCFHGNKIVFNEYVEPIEYVFKYGFDDALLSIKKNNANARIINRITLKGSSENIPYFYPNETEYGHIVLEKLLDNTNLVASDLKLVNPQKLVRNVNADESVILKKESFAGVTTSGQVFNYLKKTSASDNGTWLAVALSQWYQMDHDVYNREIRYRCYLKKFTEGVIVIRKITGQVWVTNETRPQTQDSQLQNIISTQTLVIHSVAITPSGGAAIIDATSCTEITDNGELHINVEGLGDCVIEFSIKWSDAQKDVKWQLTGIDIAPVGSGDGYYWEVGDRKKLYDLDSIGVKLVNKTINDNILNNGFKWSSESRIPIQEHLMPPKYRDTLGAERFYNALNNTYLKPDGKTYYTFKNPYVEGNPNEYIYTDETIKPTIEGIKNSQEELFGVISGIAFDADDNDSLKGDVGAEDKDKNDSANYAHSFFYIRLNKFDGENGFNLFNSASQTDAMTIQMTSGKCNGCKFKIQVVESQDGDIEVWRNPVQTLGADGSIINGTQSQIINKDNPQEWQQDTTKNYIWIAVQKDAETFGVIMPNRSHDYMPAVGDTFNIINIDLPQGYKTAAEERGMYVMLDFMEDNNEEKFNFNITASRIFFAEHPEILATLNENSRIKIEYNGEQYVQYVSEFAIDCKDSEVLPDVKLTLANTLEPGGNFVDEVVAQAVDATNIGKGRGGSGGGLTMELADKRYLRKDRDDRTEHRISSDTAFEVGNFVSGSQGGMMFVDPETGQSTLEVDYFKARIKAIFETLEIAHVRSIGGKLTITPGGSIDISFIEELPDVYRCYFKQQEETEGADCRFIVGDNVICQSFNVSAGSHQNASNKYYWRKVTAVSNEGSYVELSKTDCATGSAAPEIGDTICQLGSDNISRQSAIVLSTVDTFSPNITLYDGVKDFTLTGKEMVDMGVDKDTHKAYFHVYGNAYIGDKEGISFLKYDNLLKLLEIKAKLQIGTTVGNQSLEEYIQQVSPPVNQEDIEEFVHAVVDPKITNIQNQIDGVIETWFYEGVPTLSNYPAIEWETVDVRMKHLGDLYYDNLTGSAYRFSQRVNGSFFWTQITDEAIAKALAAAQEAQNTANNKRRIFTDTPTTPYDIGDLWVNAAYGSVIENEILRCRISRSSGNFMITDWMRASGTYEKLLDISTQVDGKIETWNQTTDPAINWSDNDKEKHLGDLWYNPVSKNLKVYRLSSDESYIWETIEDQTAIDAYLTSLDKKRVFVDTPSGPYDVGDLWLRTWNSDSTVRKDLYKCIKTRTQNNYFYLGDWEMATFYDNTKVTIEEGIITAGTIQLANANSQSIVAGITGGESESSATPERLKIRIWAGASKGARRNAPFRVCQNGAVWMTDANIQGNVVFSGFVKPLKTNITSTNYASYTMNTPNNPSSGVKVIDVSRLTGHVVFDSSLNALISNNTINPICWMPGKIAGVLISNVDLTDREIEDYIGTTMRLVNNTNYEVTVTGNTTYGQTGSGTSFVIQSGHEAYLKCYIKYLTLSDVVVTSHAGKFIGWEILYNNIQ